MPGSDHAPPLVALVPAALALFLRALIVGAEAAHAALGGERTAELALSSSAGKLLALVRRDPERTAASIRTAASLSLALAAALAAFVALALGERAGGLPWLWALCGAGGTWLVTVFTDVVPRSVAASHPEPWALSTAWLVRALDLALWPLTRVVSGLTNLVLHPLGMRARYLAPPPPLDELQRMLTQSPDKDAPEPQLVRQLFEFAERTAKEIMIPRTDVVAVDFHAAPQGVVQLLLEEGHTRMPVFKGSLDTIVGILVVKDVLPLLQSPELIIVPDLIRPTLFVPWNMPVSKVLRELQKKRQHLAIVVDEYGGMAGIVTLEDIIEQIVGDIRDELDDEPPPVVPAGDGASLIRGDLRVAEFNRLFSAAVPFDQGYETMGGFLSALAGAIPAQADRFYQGGFEFLVARRDQRRVLEIRVARTRA